MVAIRRNTRLQVPLRNPAVLHEWNRARQFGLQRDVGARLRHVVESLPNVDDDSLERYVGDAYPIVLDGQRDAADTAARYGGLLVGAAGVVSAGLLFERLEASGVLVTPDSGTLFAPIIRARYELQTSGSMANALATAASWARTVSSNQLQAAVRTGLGVGVEAAGGQVQGYRKVVRGEACEWCASHEGQVFDSPESVPFHARDRCSVAPIIE